MQRLFASLLFCAAATIASAQHKEITITDTDAMRASADKHTTLVDQTVTLTAEQKTQVREVYMNVERQIDGLNQRFEGGGLTKEQRDEEMRGQWVNIDRTTDQRLSQILTADQMAKWREAAK